MSRASYLALAVSALLAIGSVNALAQFFSPPSILPSGGPTYVGPGDIVSFVDWYGWRCYSAAKATGSTKIAHLTRASDSTSIDIVCLSNGNPDKATADSFCNATTCTGWWYDQAGGNDASNHSGGTGFPTYKSVCQNSLPCFDGNGSTFNMSSASNVSIVGGGAATMVGVASKLSSGFNNVIQVANGNNRIRANTTGNQWVVTYTTSFGVTAADSTMHTSLYTIDGSGNTVVRIDSTEATHTGSFNGTAGVMQIMGNGTAETYEVEAGYIGTNLSSTQRTNLSTNEKNFWATP